MWLVVGARGPYASLNYKTRHDSMKGRMVVPAALDELQEVANVFGRKRRVHLEGDIPEAGVKQNISTQLIDCSVFERLELLAFDPDADDLDRSNC